MQRDVILSGTNNNCSLVTGNTLYLFITNIFCLAPGKTGRVIHYPVYSANRIVNILLTLTSPITGRIHLSRTKETHSAENRNFAFETFCIFESNCGFVFATQIVQYLFFLNLTYQASYYFLWPYRPTCVRPGRIPELLFF